MSTVNLATAKAQLSELIYRAESGEEILLTQKTKSTGVELQED